MAVKRTPRSIRFSDREWEAIVAAAERRDMQPGEFVRMLTTSALSQDSDREEALITPEIVELIKRTFRGVHLLAYLKREELYQPARRLTP